MTALLRPPRPGAAAAHHCWNALHGSARSLALAEAVAADARAWIVIAPDARELERQAAELRFFGGPGLEILTLPDWEVLPYDLYSPHADIISERLRALRGCRLRRGVVLLTAESLLARLPPVHYVQARSLDLAVGVRSTSSTARAARRRRLCQRRPGQGPGRIRAARLAVRRLSDRHERAGARRPARRRHRIDPPVRPGHAALRRRHRRIPPAAGARAAPGRRVRARLPPALPHPLRG
jgi:hypothetical protein